MTHHDRTTDAADYNRRWKAEQAKVKAAQQNESAGVHNDVVPAEQPPGIHQGTPVKNPECTDCPAKKQCQKIMAMWGARRRRPDIVRAWVQLVDASGPDMVCLSQIRQDVQPEYTSIQGYTIVREGK